MKIWNAKLIINSQILINKSKVIEKNKLTINPKDANNFTDGAEES